MEINTILNLLITYRLTADELLLIYLTFLARDEEGHPEYFQKWFQHGGNAQLRNLFNSLKEKGIILKNYETDTYDPNEVPFNKIFLKTFVKNSGKMGQELFDAYPPFLNLQGKLVSLRNIAKHYSTLEEFFFAYSLTIKHNPETHKQIMEILEWAKENDLINFGICEFIASHKWIELQYLKDHPQEGQIASTLNVYESI